MLRERKFIQKLLHRYEKKQMSTFDEKEESFYFRETEPELTETSQETKKEEYEILEREIAPKRIKCPDCGGVTLEGLEFCDKCGGELIHWEA